MKDSCWGDLKNQDTTVGVVNRESKFFEMRVIRYGGKNGNEAIVVVGGLSKQKLRGLGNIGRKSMKNLKYIKMIIKINANENNIEKKV